ncbi:MAG: hypothetical protein CME60_14330 [Halobacteriovoraceae bacterium]|nr:hypothetical protein [Halobacteriovoraceae bacterium]
MKPKRELIESLIILGPLSLEIFYLFLKKLKIHYEFKRFDRQKFGAPTEAFLFPAVEPLQDAAKANRSWLSILGA